MTKLVTEIFVLCDHASISQEQKLSVIGIFDQFFTANMPSVWPRMFLVAVLKGDPGKVYSLSLKLDTPSPSDAFPQKDLHITLGNNGKANLITELVNFPLSETGVHKFEILNGDEKVGQLEFNVTKTTATYNSDQLGKKVSN